MKPILTAGAIFAALTAGMVAQDWYQERVERFHGEEWRPHIFEYVRTDLEHIWSANGAADRERARLGRTKEELYKMQTDLDQGVYITRMGLCGCR